jgi:signal transduction histidine kinase
VLTVGSQDSGGFRNHTVRTYLTVAAQAGLALENLKLLAQIREAAVVEERARLARDLHDSVTQSVFSLGMMARAAQAQYARGLPSVADTLDKIGVLAGEALVEMRALLFELRPTALAEGGLRAALEQLIVSFKARTGTEVRFAAGADARPLHDVEVAIFRIVQEALANAAKHAQATEVTIAMAEADGRLTVTVADNGAGFDPAAPVTASADGRSGGLGLRSMRERAAAAGLALDITSAPGQGTTVTIVAPLSSAEG